MKGLKKIKNLLNNIQNKIEMKVLDVLLAKLLDKFKTNSPKVYAIIMFLSIAIHSLATTWINNYEVFIAQNPELDVTSFGGVNPILAEIVYYLSLVIAALTGSRTTEILQQEQKK